jgi:hypothetical protein
LLMAVKSKWQPKALFQFYLGRISMERRFEIWQRW